jgi:peptidyl-prolyl cis-trans isomerase D
MAKRRQTTGVPKQKAPASTSAGQESRREFKSRAEREAEIQRYVLLGTGIAVGVVVLILVAAVVIELLVNPNRVVASVNGETITVSEFQERVRLERALLNLQINNFVANISALGLDPNQFAGQEPLRTWLAQVQIPDQLGNSVINTMVADTLVRQQAAEMGITVNAEDVETQVNEFFGFDPEALAVTEPTPTVEPTITPTPFVSPTPSRTPVPTPTTEATEEATAEATEAVDTTPTFTPVPPTPTLTAEEQLAEFNTQRDTLFSNIVRSARISRERLNEYFETQALRKALSESRTDLTNEVPHVNARHILVATEEDARDILAALEAGESFAGLAQAASTDTGSGRNGGELGWAPVTNFVPPFAEAAASADIGALVGPVESEFGWHIIQVHDREVRSITDDELENARLREFERWLEDLRASEATRVEISSIWADNVPSDPAFVLTAPVN